MGLLTSGSNLALMARDAYPIFPFYLVIDVSGSMHDRLPAINAELPQLQREIASDPIVGEIARFGVISFSQSATMEMPLSDLLKVDRMPELEAGGPTNYGAAFRFMKACLPHDAQWFASEGYRLYRPAIFFITDGVPTDRDWQSTHAELVAPGFDYRPNIVAFGFGDADPETLRQVATYKAYVANDEQRPASVLKTIAKELTRSIMASSQKAASGQAVLSLPDEVDGMRQLDVV